MSTIMKEEVVSTSELSKQIGTSLSVAFLIECGVSPIHQGPRAAFWRKTDIPLIRQAIATRIASGRPALPETVLINPQPNGD